MKLSFFLITWSVVVLEMSVLVNGGSGLTSASGAKCFYESVDTYPSKTTKALTTD